METFKRQLRELVPHSPLGWDSDSLADAVYGGVPLLRRSAYAKAGSGEGDCYGFLGRNVRWIRIYSSSMVEEIAELMREFIAEAAKGCLVRLDVVVEHVENISREGDGDRDYYETFIVIHTPKD